jgi:hypothetical protein
LKRRKTRLVPPHWRTNGRSKKVAWFVPTPRKKINVFPCPLCQFFNSTKKYLPATR